MNCLNVTYFTNHTMDRFVSSELNVFYLILFLTMRGTKQNVQNCQVLSLSYSKFSWNSRFLFSWQNILNTTDLSIKRLKVPTRIIVYQRTLRWTVSTEIWNPLESVLKHDSVDCMLSAFNNLLLPHLGLARAPQICKN